MFKFFHEHLTVEQYSAFIFFSSMKAVRNFTVGKTVLHEISKNWGAVESHAVPSHEIVLLQCFHERVGFEERLQQLKHSRIVCRHIRSIEQSLCQYQFSVIEKALKCVAGLGQTIEIHIESAS